MTKINGLTLVELLISLSITAILVGIALPSFNQLIDTIHATQDLNRMSHILNFARSEAVASRSRVIVCPSSPNKTQCGKQWSQTWLVFADKNNNEKRDSNEVILKQSGRIRHGATIKWKSYRSKPFVRFDALGTTIFQNGRFYYCSKNGEIKKQLIVFRTGRVRIARKHEVKDSCG